MARGLARHMHEATLLQGHEEPVEGFERGASAAMRRWSCGTNGRAEQGVESGPNGPSGHEEVEAQVPLHGPLDLSADESASDCD